MRQSTIPGQVHYPAGIDQLDAYCDTLITIPNQVCPIERAPLWSEPLTESLELPVEALLPLTESLELPVEALLPCRT